jgi:hypothetical protein
MSIHDFLPLSLVMILIRSRREHHFRFEFSRRPSLIIVGFTIPADRMSGIVKSADREIVT